MILCLPALVVEMIGDLYNFSFISQPERSTPMTFIANLRANVVEKKQGERLIRRPVRGCQFEIQDFGVKSWTRGICGTLYKDISKSR